MRCNPVEKPPVVRYDHCTPCKAQKSLLKGSERIYVKMVGRFVKQQDVCSFFQRFCQVYPGSFTPGEFSNFLLLVTSAKIKAGDIGAGMGFPIPTLHDLRSSASLSPDIFVRIQ